MGIIVEEVTNYVCPVCGEYYEWEDDAYGCCSYKCPVCGEWHDNEEDSLECCQGKCPICNAYYEDEVDVRACCVDKKDEYGDPLPNFPCQSCGKIYPEVCECQKVLPFPMEII